jgi:cyanophycinase
MKCKIIYLLANLILFAAAGVSQVSETPKGSLFVIGGGSRSFAMMQSLVKTAQLSKKDYIVVLPMSSEEPDTAYFYIAADFRKVCTNTVANLNFTKENLNDKLWLDSLQKARLIFITGGDQNRFMKLVSHTQVERIIQKAYAAGATIAGTSAGAAMMSEKMITGNEISGDSIRPGSFKTIRYNTVEIAAGLGLIKNAIIDQHFIARSRYNRVLTALATFPSYPCIGIDEGAALIIKGKNVKIEGEGQVITFTVLSPYPKHDKANSLVNIPKIQMSVLTKGDVFLLK